MNIKKNLQQMGKEGKEDFSFYFSVIGAGAVLYFFYYKLKKREEQTPIISNTTPSLGIRG